MNNISFDLSCKQQQQLLAGNLTTIIKNILLRGLRTVGASWKDFQISWLIDAAESGQGGDGLCSRYSRDKNTELQHLRTSGCHFQLSTVSSCNVAADRCIRKVQVGSCVSADVVFWRYAHSVFDSAAKLPPCCQVLLTLHSFYCLHSSLNLARPFQSICHVELNHCGLLISLREQRPQCRREGTASERYVTRRPDCHLSIWRFFFFFYREGNIRWCQAGHCVVGFIRKGWNKCQLWVWSSFSQAGSQFVSQLGSQGGWQAVCSIMIQSTSQPTDPALPVM